MKYFIIGHQKQWRFLKKTIEKKPSHAFLFVGQEKLGKKRMALEFIKLLNCEKKNGKTEPCQNCYSCKGIEKNQSPDFLLIEPEKKEIQISRIRDLNWKLSLKAYSHSFKTAIIDQAHLMNEEAQNCLLKTLEEPRGDAVLILISEFPERIFPTVVSRCQIIKFHPVARQEIENFLKTQKIFQKEKDIIEIIKLSEGKPGMLMDFISDPKKLEYERKIVSDLQKICQSDLGFRFQYLKNILDDSQDIKEILKIWMRYFRDILISHIEQKNEKGIFSRQYSLNHLTNILNLIQRIFFLISFTNVNTKLSLEIILLEL